MAEKFLKLSIFAGLSMLMFLLGVLLGSSYQSYLLNRNQQLIRDIARVYHLPVQPLE